MNDEIKKIIHIFIIIFITVLIVTIIALLILKYNVEGENNMPFELSKIMVVSSAEGQENNEIDNEAKWNLKLFQNNDIYLEISKNKNYNQTEIIDEIIIDNFKIDEATKIGKIKLYKPTNNEEKIYENSQENEITDKLIYKGNENSSIKNLEIANQGGLVLFRYSIEDIGDIISDDDEIKHDGTILAKNNINYEDIKFKVSFDVSIKLKNDVTYTGNINLNLPAGNIINDGISHYEITNLKNIIFKRNLR